MIFPRQHDGLSLRCSMLSCSHGLKGIPVYVFSCLVLGGTVTLRLFARVTGL